MPRAQLLTSDESLAILKEKKRKKGATWRKGKKKAGKSRVEKLHEENLRKKQDEKVKKAEEKAKKQQDKKENKQ